METVNALNASANGSRDRVTIDLRGLGRAVHVASRARQLTVAAFVRQAIVAQLEALGGLTSVGAAPDLSAVLDANLDRDEWSRTIKVTLRLPVAHAVLLTRRARRADVSQGRYVAGLLDNQPVPPQPADQADRIAALVGSTDQLAALSTDLNAMLRLLMRGNLEAAKPHRDRITTLNADVQTHLAIAGALIKVLQPLSASQRPGQQRRIPGRRIRRVSGMQGSR